MRINTSIRGGFPIWGSALLGLVALTAFGQTAGTIVTVAGTGNGGYNGDNQAATSAQLNAPPFVAVDAAGNIYIADEHNNRVRKVDTSGKITTIAGTGSVGFSGDGGPATSAQLNGPTGVFVDGSGNVYINDPGNQRIRKIDGTGKITTIAGTGSAGYNGDGIAATSANLFNAVRTVVDPAGNIYIADQSDHRIRKIDTNGIITTIVGTGTAGYNGDGVGTSTLLNNPTALALDSAGNLYFSDQFNHRIRELTAGRVVTLAGTGTAGYNGDGIALNTQLNFPGGLAVDPTTQAIYFTDGPNYRLRKLSTDRTQITTIAGTGTAGYNGDNIAANTAQLSTDFGVAVDSLGNIYIADTGNNRIRKISSFGAGTPTFIGSMPHLAALGGWNTSFTFVNKGTTAASLSNNLYAPNGSQLPLPIVFPQTGTSTTTASVTQTVAANASFVMQATGTASVPYLEGSAQLAATGNVDGFAIFHFDPNQQEAVVPMETRTASSYVLALDNTNGVLTGVAIANVSASASSIPVIIRDDKGNLLSTTFLSLPANGHTSFVLSDPAVGFPATANLRGTIEFDAPSGAQISVLGIRYTGGTITTLPSIANVGTTGGLMAHLASANGWQTTFVLVNTGANAASATLNFYDDGGNALNLPLTSPQGTFTASTAPTITQSVPGHGTLWIQSAGALGAPLLTGSAQLTTTGNIGGFVIFRYNPNGQEAVVPLETRNANAYVIPFDNTNGTVTGIALSAQAPLANVVPVVIRDDKGNAIGGAGNLAISINGHTSFVLSQQFSITTNIRGTIEFQKPVGAQISVIGIRTPPALTFTTLPPLAK